jgi:hypothetical protein
MHCSRSNQPNSTLLALYYISVFLVLLVGLVSFVSSFFTEEPILLFNEFLTVCMLILFWLTLLSATTKNLNGRHPW